MAYITQIAYENATIEQKYEFDDLTQGHGRISI